MKQPTRKEEAFEAHYCSNGFNGTQAAADAGYKGNRATLAAIASENLRKPHIASRVRARLDGLHANANEVLNLLADHLRADIADFKDFFDEDGRLDLGKAQEAGVSHLIKKYKTVTRRIPQGKDADGKEREPIREVTTELELHDSQAAAAKHLPVLGLKQRPAENEKDAERRRGWAEEQLRRVIAETGMTREDALGWMQAHTPAAARWIN